MKFLSKFMVLFLLSSCSLDNTPEDLTWRTFPTEWQGYYKLESNTGSLYYLKKEFKVSEDYITFKNYTSSSTGYYDEDKFSTYQIYYIYENDTKFKFDVCQAYQEQDIPWGVFGFEKDGDDVIVSYYSYFSSSRPEEYATYKKSDTPFE